MKIVSYNVNGIRAAIKKGFVEWLKENDFDIVCIQETKANEDQVDLDEIRNLGYDIYWFGAQKKGYSGVAIFSKTKALNVLKGQENELYDFEGRTIQLEFEEFVIINTYFPSGSSGDLRQQFKFKFLEDYFNYITSKLEKKLIVVGDYNICHRAIDIHNPKGLKNASGFLPVERAWMDKWFSSGFVDSYRLINGDIENKYSWWSYRANARNNNKGWRLDYISVSQELSKYVIAADILKQVKHSDHCPVLVELNLNES